MKISDFLTIISSILTFLLIIFLISRVLNTSCFDWIDYIIAFGTLFANIGINILAALER